MLMSCSLLLTLEFIALGVYSGIESALSCSVLTSFVSLFERVASSLFSATTNFELRRMPVGDAASVFEPLVRS